MSHGDEAPDATGRWVVRDALLSRWPLPDAIGDVVIDAGVIVGIGAGAGAGADAIGDAPDGSREISARGLRLAPGLIDVQINGGHGIDLAANPERLGALAAALPAHGVTSFLPTIVSSPPSTVDAARAALGATAEPVSAVPLGLHLEGPMLRPERRGAHRAEHLRRIDEVDLRRWTAADGVRLVTLAPELPGALEAVERLVAAGVVVSAGHTEASAAQLEAAADAGLRGVTHLFNAMPALHHRAPGPVGGALDDDRLLVGLIADGLHVDPIVMRLAQRVLGPDRLVLVSDAVAAMGLADGRHRLGEAEIELRRGAVRDADGRLAGSAVALDDCVRCLVDHTGCEPSAALASATSTPARLIGERGRGRLEAGAVADLVLLDGELRVVATWVGGRLVHAVPGAPEGLSSTATRAPADRSPAQGGRARE